MPLEQDICIYLSSPKSKSADRNLVNFVGKVHKHILVRASAGIKSSKVRKIV